MAGLENARVVAVSSSPTHTMSKINRETIRLLAGLGVEDDAHQGVTVKHRSRVARDPTQPNLRQVHLLHAELLDELRSAGFVLAPGDMGENVMTEGVDLLGLASGSRLHLGAGAIVEVTGLRNPCAQLDKLHEGLMAKVARNESGELVRRAGVMAIVVAPGEVRANDPIRIEAPAGEQRPLGPV